MWTFETKNFRVSFEAIDEDMLPEDAFENQDDIANAYNGGSWWFVASVTVERRIKGTWVEIGSDCLGGCSYETFEQFYAGHRDIDPMNRNCSIMRKARGENVAICHYFPDMVRKAIAMARKTIAPIT